MHFSKTYAQLLLTLPPELRENAIEYRKLKKLINQVVHELSSLGLSPELLHELLEQSTATVASSTDKAKGKATEDDQKDSKRSSLILEGSLSSHPNQPKVVYEISSDSDRIQPRLRLWISSPNSENPSRSLAFDSNVHTAGDLESLGLSGMELKGDIESRLLPPPTDMTEAENEAGSEDATERTEVGPSRVNGAHEVIIPLASDTAFFQLLITAIQTLSTHLNGVYAEFINDLRALAQSVAHAARPSSHSHSFHPHSGVSSDAGLVHVGSSKAAKKSDLYAWREFFQLYIEAEIFESISEQSRGERTIEECEERLQLFTQRLKGRGLDKRKWKLPESRKTMNTFIELNMLVLNLKKFQYANAEATRKILKKHAKRTALPLPSFDSVAGVSTNALVLSSSPSSAQKVYNFVALSPGAIISLPRLLIQAIGENLLPIIPHIDDYACLICTSIAFKPIRLGCGHLFCVRCLVKMQKRGKGNCPMCRAPTVLTADRSNVDWALLNFMKDWFPVESKAKLKANEREAAEEELQELGLDSRACVIC